MTEMTEHLKKKNLQFDNITDIIHAKVRVEES